MQQWVQNPHSTACLHSKVAFRRVELTAPTRAIPPLTHAQVPPVWRCWTLSDDVRTFLSMKKAGKSNRSIFQVVGNVYWLLLKIYIISIKTLLSNEQYDIWCIVRNDSLCSNVGFEKEVISHSLILIESEKAFLIRHLKACNFPFSFLQLFFPSIIESKCSHICYFIHVGMNQVRIRCL